MHLNQNYKYKTLTFEIGDTDDIRGLGGSDILLIDHMCKLFLSLKHVLTVNGHLCICRPKEKLAYLNDQMPLSQSHRILLLLN